MKDVMLQEGSAQGCRKSQQVRYDVDKRCETVKYTVVLVSTGQNASDSTYDVCRTVLKNKF